MTIKCKNCGGDDALHHYQTSQCPVGGVEARGDRPQEWKTSTFEADIPFSPPQRLARDMTIREYFAGRAMQGALAGEWSADEVKATPAARSFAYAAVKFADALIKELNK